MSTPAMTPWRGPVNELLYGVDTTRPVPDEDVYRVASLVIGQRVYGDPVATYYDAAMAALTSRDALAPAPEDGNARDFLRRLADALAARHPWPEPPFRAVSDASAAPPSMRPVGHIDRGWLSVQDVVGAPFKHSEGAFRLLLRMASGALVLLRAPDGASTVDVSTDAADVDAVRGELSGATRLVLTGP